LIHCLKLIKTVDYNKAYLNLLDAENIEEVYKSPAKGPREEFLSFARNIILMIADGAVWEEREEYLTTVKGNRRCVLGKSLVIKGHEDRLSSVIMTLTDITKLKEAQEALRASEQRYRQQSLRDNLTGLYNRRYLYSSLSKLMEASKTEGMNLSVLFIDLDDFKQVVDTYGHLNGSQAIQEIAGTIRECLEEPAYAVSYAGDEFIVVLPAADNIQAIEKASEIRLRISNTNYLKSQGIQAKLSASFGIATFPDHGSDLRGLLASADAALFEAKRSFKGAVKSAQKKVVKRGYY
ncbi:MAG: diguanylate cyclase, partial [Anaerolineales bacterium]